MQSRNPNNYQGIDVSSNNSIDFVAARAAGYKIAYIKASEGISYINPKMVSQYQAAKAAGLLVGFYHYFTPLANPENQALYFEQCIGGLGMDCIPALDVEDSGGLDPLTLSAAVHACANEMGFLTGQTVMLYTYTDFVPNLQGSLAGAYPLWIADYNGQGTPAKNSIWATWAGFQYSDKGNIKGALVDLNEFTTSILIGG
jgi:lysozyme